MAMVSSPTFDDIALIPTKQWIDQNSTHTLNYQQNLHPKINLKRSFIPQENKEFVTNSIFS